MEYLRKIRDGLVANRHDCKNYHIPAIWDSRSFHHARKESEIVVNPYDFLIELIDRNWLNQDDPMPSFRKGETAGKWIAKSVIYSMMIRTATSWDHDHDHRVTLCNANGHRETGTFLKALILLPYLKYMGIDTLSLLPVCRYSTRNKKGDLGSCYSIRHPLELDERLHDLLLQGQATVEDEFKAFVEACHKLGINVLIDSIPRTAAIDSDLILDHPDWFYYIPIAELKNYKSPHVDGLQSNLVADPKYLGQIYQSDEVLTHIRKFCRDPKSVDPVRWQHLLTRHHEQGEPVLDLIEEMYGNTIAPAFSDCINDPQPAWSDITYLRLYQDHPKLSLPYLSDPHTAPYILFDVAKSSLNPGKLPHHELWDFLAGIIPHFITCYGIDGARIDMGHALPPVLLQKIIHEARLVDPDFAFVAEELDLDRDVDTKAKGYNLYVGNGFLMEPRIKEHCLNTFLYQTAQLTLPVMALGETHDTPRLAARTGGKSLSRMLTMLNLFVPNAVPFINGGQEIYEIQPMNLGLDCDSNERWRLEKKDPYYGKLALYDTYCLHWTQQDACELPRLLHELAAFRHAYRDRIADPSQSCPVYFNHPWDLAAGFVFINESEGLIMIANTDLYHDQVHAVDFIKVPSRIPLHEIRPVFSSCGQQLEDSVTIGRDRKTTIAFKAGEVKLFTFPF